MFKSAGFKLISSYFILHEDSHFSTAEFIKEIFLTILCWQNYKDLFLVLYSISLVFMSVIQRVAFFLDYSHLQHILKSDTLMFPALFFLLRLSLVGVGLL